MFRLACLLAVLCLGLVACKTEESGALPIQPNKEPEPVYFSISGRVVAGVLHGAPVELYAVVDGSPANTPIVTAETDASGYFRLTDIPEQYKGAPAVIKVAVHGAQAVCDSVRGCGQYRFGQSYTVNAPEFFLRTSIPRLQAGGVYNGTLLTHLANTRAEHLLAQASSGGLEDQAVSRYFSSANAQVSRRFGVIGDLLSFSTIDITNEAEMVQGSAADLNYSAMNVALAESLLASAPEVSVWDSLDLFAADFAQRGIAGHSEMGDQSVTQEHVLRRLLKIYRYLQAEYDLDYTSALSEIAVQRGLVLNEPFGRYTQGRDEARLVGPIEKAKALVHDIRQIASSINLSKLVTLTDMSALFSGNASEIFEGFGVALDASELLEGARLAPVTSAAQTVALVTLEALRSQLQEGFVPERIDGVAVQHELVGGKHVISVFDSIDVCDKHQPPCHVQSDIQFVFELASFGGNAEGGLLIVTGLRTQVSGHLDNGEYRIEIPENIAEIEIDRLAMTLGQGAETGKTLVEIDTLQGEVPLRLVSAVDQQETSIEGVLSGAVKKLQTIFFDSEDVYDVDQNTVEVVSTSVFELYQLDGLNLTMSGLVDVGQEDEFFAAFNLLQNTRAFSGMVEYRRRSSRTCDRMIENCQEGEQETELEGETEESFLGVSASIGFKSHLKGVREPAVVQISGSRESITANVLNNMTVVYPGHAFRLNGRFSNIGAVLFLDARNQDGIQLNVDSNSKGRRSGAITTQLGESLADIVDMGQWLQIRYNDGAFQSL